MLCNSCGMWIGFGTWCLWHQSSVRVGRRRSLGVCLRRWESMVTLDMRRAPDLAQRPGSDWWCADVKLDGVRHFWHGLSRSKYSPRYSHQACPHQHRARLLRPLLMPPMSCRQGATDSEQ